MSRLKRSALMHFLSVEDGKWYLIGAEVEELAVEMNGTFSSGRDITDNTDVTDEGYEPLFEVSPYRARPGDGIYEWLRNVALRRLDGENCKARYMEMIVSNQRATSHSAWTEDCYIEINSYGGKWGGLQIDFTVHCAGDRSYGKASLSSSKQPYFIADFTAIVGKAIVGQAIFGVGLS